MRSTARLMAQRSVDGAVEWTYLVRYRTTCPKYNKHEILQSSATQPLSDNP